MLQYCGLGRSFFLRILFCAVLRRYRLYDVSCSLGKEFI